MAGELPPHSILAALRLAGRQRTQVMLHHDGSPEAAITVAVGRSVIYLHTRATAERIGDIWRSAATDALQLPMRRATTRAALIPPDIAEPSVVVHTAGRPAGIVRLGYEPGEERRASYLHVQLGTVIFQMYDQLAFSSSAHAFAQAAQLGVDHLPDRDIRRAPPAPQQRQQVGGQAAQGFTPFPVPPSVHPAARAAEALRSPSMADDRAARSRQSGGHGSPSPRRRATTPPEQRRMR